MELLFHQKDNFPEFILPFWTSKLSQEIGLSDKLINVSCATITQKGNWIQF